MTHVRGPTVRPVATCAALIFALQCASMTPGAAADLPVELTVVGGPQLNPNVQGRPSPVVVRLFELTASEAFESADYTALLERPNVALGRDVIKQEEFVLRPGDIQTHDRELPPAVRFIGIAAAFRGLDHAVWHLTVAVRPGRRNFVLFAVEQDTIRLIAVDPGP